MRRFLFSLIGLIVWGCSLNAQHHPTKHEGEIDESHYDSFADFFQKGEFDIHARSFFMGTQNRGELSDYSAWAAGAGIGYRTPHFKGFSAGFGGFFIFKLHDRNLGRPDPLTGGINRYELTLFDMNDPLNGEDLDRLEELYLEYKKGNFIITGGRQHIETPLLNGQDNRMRPNIFSGYWASYKMNEVTAEGGWIRRVSPRGTVDWYDMDASLGVYPFGRNVDGNPSKFKGNTSTAGVFAVGASLKNERWDVKFYNYLAENIFNVAYAHGVRTIDWRPGWEVDLGIQGFHQTAVGQGGNPDPAKKYIQNGEQTFGAGTKIAAKHRNHILAFNTMYIHDSGRFLFPREWGREQFWANLPRERFEGNGGFMAFMTSWTFDSFANRLSTFLGASVNYTQEPAKARLNRNGMPSWYHLAGRTTWHFDKSFEGLVISTMLVYKGALGDAIIPDALAINRVEMWNYNLIVDYKF